MKKHILSLAIMASLMVSCSKIDLDNALGDLSLGTSLATPIGTIDITLSDLYKQFDTIIAPEIADDGTVFVYWEEAIKIDEFDIKDFVINAGAEMLVAIAGDIIRMPGLPKSPQALRIGIVDGQIEGLS